MKIPGRLKTRAARYFPKTPKQDGRVTVQLFEKFSKSPSISLFQRGMKRHLLSKHGQSSPPFEKGRMGGIFEKAFCQTFSFQNQRPLYPGINPKANPVISSGRGGSNSVGGRQS
jgi:hypothetical protein